MPEKEMKLVIVTGMSGAGKTVAIQSFEDLGYFTIDNIPPTLVPKFLQLLETTNDIDKLALVVDMRSRSFFAEIQNVLDQVENNLEIDFVCTKGNEKIYERDLYRIEKAINYWGTTFESVLEKIEYYFENSENIKIEEVNKRVYLDYDFDSKFIKILLKE